MEERDVEGLLPLSTGSPMSLDTRFKVRRDLSVPRLFAFPVSNGKTEISSEEWVSYIVFSSHFPTRM
jgi:hypothetical protein